MGHTNTLILVCTCHNSRSLRYCVSRLVGQCSLHPATLYLPDTQSLHPCLCVVFLQWKQQRAGKSRYRQAVVERLQEGEGIDPVVCQSPG